MKLPIIESVTRLFPNRETITQRLWLATWPLAFLAMLPLLTIITLADEPAANRPIEAFSTNGRFVIRMTPAKPWGDDGHGIVFVKDVGETKLWSVEWYASEVKLADSGEHLVRYGPWANDQENHTDLAIAFYYRAKLRKSYRVRDLVRAPQALQNSVSHYQWRATRPDRIERVQGNEWLSSGPRGQDGV